jgi:hypothetical protein
MTSSSGVSSFFSSNASVKAWALFAFGTPPSIPVPSSYSNNSLGAVNAANFVNGFNLVIDQDKYLALTSSAMGQGVDTQTGYSIGPIPLRFITPMPNDKYKIFVQPKMVGDTAVVNETAVLAHALNTPQYPKTKEGFWVRFGQNTRTSDTYIDTMNQRGTGIVHGQILSRREAYLSYQMQVLVL